MARPKAALGDTHNFGRHVSVRGRFAEKPRCIVWERLVLSASSPLRRALASAATREGWGSDAFDFLPDLRFRSSRTGIGGDVERVTLAPLGKLSVAERDALAVIVGRSIALWSWLGVTDLHWENLVLGRGAGQKIVFAPLDVEMILSDFALPTETKLLPDADPEYADVCQHACGVRRVLPFLGKPVPARHVVGIAAAYLEALALLDRHAGAIAQVLASMPELQSAPIRVCLRSTAEYVAPPDDLWPPFLDEEREQLERGDVPYFFRCYGQPGIHFYGDVSLRTVRTLPRKGDVPQLEPLLSVSRALRSPSRKRLREEGLFTVLGAFDHVALEGRHASGALEIDFRPRTLVAKHSGRSGFELRARRDMGAFVTPVYLPCRCGEVRSVFVPPVTKCS